jgi:uncharacterized protein YicC (UPF0701 family)
VIDTQFVDGVTASLKTLRKEIIACLKDSHNEKIGPIEDLFEDVYQKVPEHLERQQNELREHLKEYSALYPKGRFYSKQ